MSRITLEISPPPDDVVVERLFEGLSVLLRQVQVGHVTESRSFGAVHLFVVQSVNDAVARTLIDEILDNEQISGSVTLAIGAEVPVAIRGEAWPGDPVHDSIVGSFTNMETEGSRKPKICFYCRNFSMKSVDLVHDLQMRCAKGLDDGAFEKPLSFIKRPHESVLRMREAFAAAEQCGLFEED